MASLFEAGGVFAIIFFVIGLFVVAGGLLLSFNIARNMRATAISKAGNDAFPILEIQAKLISKRTRSWGTDQTNITYYITFETDERARMEFNVSAEQYAMIGEGDIGTLRHQGTRYIGFTRDLQAHQVIAASQV